MAAVSNSPYNLLSSLLNSTRFVFEKIRKQEYPISTSQQGFVQNTIDFQAFTTPAPLSLSTPTAESFLNSSSQVLATQTHPGLWSFFTSQYAIVIILITVVMRRLENIVLPSPVSRFQGQQRRHNRGLRLWDLPSVALGRLVPLNFSSTKTRLALHLPTLLLLSRHLLIWAFLIVHTSGLSLEIPPYIRQYVPWHEALARLGNWVEAQEMAALCWGTFRAMCAAFCVEHFIQVLDGLDSGVIWRLLPSNPNSSAANLAGNAMLLYFYSFPSNHVRGPAGLPSRPDVHTILIIAIQIFQLAVFHVLAVSKRLATHRFFPTAFTSLVSLIHFYWTICASYFDASQDTSSSIYPSTGPASSSDPFGSMPSATHSASPSTFITTTLTSFAAKPSPVSQRTSSSAPHRNSSPYPAIAIAPNVALSLFIFIIFLTIFFNAVVQLLVRGRIERLFSGLSLGQSLDLEEDIPEYDMEHDSTAPSSGFRAFLASIPMEQDFNTVILRIGTASLEATGLYGWRNEVAGIAVHPNRTSRPHQAGADGRRFGGVRLGNHGVVGSVVKGGVVKEVKGKRRQTGGKSGHQTVRKPRMEVFEGLNNDVQMVNVGVPRNRSSSGPALGDPSSRSAESAFLKELLQFAKQLGGVVIGGGRALAWSLWLKVSGRSRRVADGKPAWNRSPSIGVMSSVQDPEDDEDNDGEEIYQRFLRGENLSDEDEGSEYEEESDDTNPTLCASRYNTPALFATQHDDADGDEGVDPEPPSLLTEMLTGSWLKRGRTPAVSRDTTPVPPAGHAEEPHDMTASSRVMLAHMFYDTGRLTRSRYSEFNQTFSRFSSDANLEESDPNMDLSPSSSRQSSRQVTPFNGYEDTGMGDEVEGGKGREMCVICTVDAREIICWPCRCLAMCDGCRIKLAERSGGRRDGHRCPCCRRLVEGFSRIYVP